MPKSFGIAVLSMCLETVFELSSKVSILNETTFTIGLEVVWWQKVEPVGLILGGNLER